MADFIRSQSTEDRGLTQEQLRELLAWLRPLQQALTLESDRGCCNLQGRQQRFDSFLQQQLAQPPQDLLPPGAPERLARLQQGYCGYVDLADSGRRRLVTETRQWLHELRHRLEPSAPMKPPRLKLKPAERGKVARTLALDSGLTQLQGVGPKLAARLAGIGLLLVRDLLKHYPRDHVDYATRRRIEALEPGETATIVATIHRCNGFVSPRNPNLAILELQLQDPTGRIKVSRFLAGRRFSSPAYLKGQQRLYPVGATVAVSGLVKDGGYGLTFQEPLIEVLESSDAPVQSRSIGRLLPVYPLTEGVASDRFRQLIDQVLPLTKTWPEPLGQEERQRWELITCGDALEGCMPPAISRPWTRLAAGWSSMNFCCFSSVCWVDVGTCASVPRRSWIQPHRPLVWWRNFFPCCPFPSPLLSNGCSLKSRRICSAPNRWRGWCRVMWVPEKRWWRSPPCSARSVRDGRGP